MRAAVTDRRPTPAGVDVGPPLAMWTLAGGATYNPATKEVTLPAVNAKVTSPLIRVDAAASALCTVPVYVPAGGDARTVASMYYYGPDGVTPVANTLGNAANGNASPAGATDTWRSWTVGAALGPGITYLQWVFTVSPAYSVPGTQYRKPVITLTR